MGDSEVSVLKMSKQIKSRIVWKLLRLLPLGLRLKVASRYDNRVNHLFSYYGESFKKNVDWKGDVDVLSACLEEKDKKKQKKLIEVWMRCIKSDKRV